MNCPERFWLVSREAYEPCLLAPEKHQRYESIGGPVMVKHSGEHAEWYTEEEKKEA